MSARRAASVLALALGMLASAVGDACACSCVMRDHGFLAPPHLVLPSNARGVPWSGRLHQETPADTPRLYASFTVERRSGGQWVRMAAEAIATPARAGGSDRETAGGDVVRLVRPRGGLTPGASYRFRWFQAPPAHGGATAPKGPAVQQVLVDVAREPFDPRGLVAHVRVGPARNGNVVAATTSGSCRTTFVGNSRTIELELPARLRRFSDAVLTMVTLNAGEVWRPDSSLCNPTAPGLQSMGPRKENLYSYCGPGADPRSDPPDFALPQGVHEVLFTAWLPGTDHRISGRTKVTLGCPPRGRR